MLSWMSPTKRIEEEEWVGYFRRWRTRFNTVGYSWGPAQVKRWLTFAGHLAHMEDFRFLFEWRMAVPRGQS